MSEDKLFPSGEPVGYQVWHKQGEHHQYVAYVESNALGAMLMTTNGFMGFERWQDNPRVKAVPGEHRSTTLGDILINREGNSHEIAGDRRYGLLLKPVGPTQAAGKDDVSAAVPKPSVPNSARRAQFQSKDKDRGLDR